MDDALIVRRARWVYEAARLAAATAQAPVVPAPWDEREEAFHAQFLAIIERQCGPDRSGSPEELHGSWWQAYMDLGWIYGPDYDPVARTHPDMVPYAQLPLLERDKDEVFLLLCEIARQWIREKMQVLDGGAEPTIEEVSGIVDDFTDGMSLEGYLEELRG